MKISTGIMVTLLLLSAVACPALALQADTLTISLDREGNADVVFTYHLTWLEYFAVFLKIGDPGSEIKNALEDNLHRPVTVQSAGTDSTSLTVEGFALVERSNGITTLRTPALSFAAAEKVLQSYWFAPLVSPDFSPAVTKVRFPDGYEETFFDKISIPALTHTYPS
jgi:hypothetical protein